MSEKKSSFVESFKMVANKKRPSKFWSILDMIALVIVVIGTKMDIFAHKWSWVPLDVVLVALWIFFIRKDWAWYPKAKDDDKKDDLNKTKELRDTWKDTV